MLKSLNILLLFFNVSAAFAVDLSVLTENERIDLSPSEFCYKSVKNKDFKYSNKDIEKETKLCNLQFENIGLCPKITSTSAGIKLFDNSLKLSVNEFNDRFCVTIKPTDSKKEVDLKSYGKFKYTMDLTYAPSSLAYYHLSRALDAGRVPVSVLKTIDTKLHKNIAENAIKNLNNLGVPSSKMIYQSWININARYKSSDSKLRRGFVDDKTGLAVGVIVEKVKNDLNYSELDTFPDFNNLDKTPIYKKAFSSSSLQNQLGTQFKTINAAKTATEVKDISDMVIMDTLLEQVDRYGNMSASLVWKYIENNQLVSIKADYGNDDKILESQKIEMKSKNAVLIKELMLIDNDAGIIFNGEFKKKDYVTQLKHMSPITYARLLKLYKNKESFESLLTKSLMVSSTAAQNVENNLINVMQTLIKNCKAGTLILDADIEFLTGLTEKPVQQNCE